MNTVVGGAGCVGAGAGVFGVVAAGAGCGCGGGVAATGVVAGAGAVSVGGAVAAGAASVPVWGARVGGGLAPGGAGAVVLVGRERLVVVVVDALLEIERSIVDVVVAAGGGAVALMTTGEDAAAAGAYVPRAPTIARNDDVLRPAARTRLPAAGWRRRCPKADCRRYIRPPVGVRSMHRPIGAQDLAHTRHPQRRRIREALGSRSLRPCVLAEA